MESFSSDVDFRAVSILSCTSTVIRKRVLCLVNINWCLSRLRKTTVDRSDFENLSIKVKRAAHWLDTQDRRSD